MAYKMRKDAKEPSVRDSIIDFVEKNPSQAKEIIGTDDSGNRIVGWAIILFVFLAFYWS